jgi:nitroimidazol reductase NimA-like FMN-containing flavoprotein (pyridoxamine 5'-phosphate oxidase superfamily)
VSAPTENCCARRDRVLVFGEEENARKGGDVAADLRQTDKTTISRHAERGSYDREAAYAVLDEGMVAHVGFNSDDGVIVIPMTYARLGDELVLHGAVASRWLSSFEQGRPVSVCVTLLDGLVLAQSAFSHSMNYRSIVCFGNATVVKDDTKKDEAFKAFLDHLIPGRWEDSRQPDAKESGATIVLSVPIDEARTPRRTWAWGTGPALFRSNSRPARRYRIPRWNRARMYPTTCETTPARFAGRRRPLTRIPAMQRYREAFREPGFFFLQLDVAIGARQRSEIP